MINLTVLKDHIRNGNDPDIYRAIRSLCPFPVPPEASDTFLQIGHAIMRLYPERVREPLDNSYAARIIAMEFCEHERTSRTDIMRVLTSCEQHNHRDQRDL